MVARRSHSQPPLAQGLEWLSSSVEQTQGFGRQLGRVLRGGDVVACYGTLGSGKTTWIQGIAAGLGISPERVKSPTFVLMREYPGSIPLVHLDGYRLEAPVEVGWLDPEWMFAPHKVTVIEWAERFADWLPEGHIEIRLQYVSSHRRKITLIPHARRAQEIFAQLQG